MVVSDTITLCIKLYVYIIKAISLQLGATTFHLSDTTWLGTVTSVESNGSRRPTVAALPTTVRSFFPENIAVAIQCPQLPRIFITAGGTSAPHYKKHQKQHQLLVLALLTKHLAQQSRRNVFFQLEKLSRLQFGANEHAFFFSINGGYPYWTRSIDGFCGGFLAPIRQDEHLTLSNQSTNQASQVKQHRKIMTSSDPPPTMTFQHSHLDITLVVYFVRWRLLFLQVVTPDSCYSWIFETSWMNKGLKLCHSFWHSIWQIFGLRGWEAFGFRWSQ